MPFVHGHSALTSAPFLINGFVSAEIQTAILPNWRWGYGMFAILVNSRPKLPVFT